MSHFAVAVIIKDINDLEGALAPYQENNMGDCPREYMEFHSYSKKYKDEYENETTEMAKMPDGRLIDTWSSELDREITKEEYEQIEEENKNAKDGKYRSLKSSTMPEKYSVRDLEYFGAEIVEVPYKELYETFEKYLEDWHDATFDEEMQDYGYWENPNAKWDYWTLCQQDSWARFQNEKIPLGYCQLKDLDKCINEANYKKAIRFWEIVVDEQPLEDGEKPPFNIYRKEYYIETYSNKENYATIQSTPHYWAFILNGQWYEKGKMGWWAMNTADKNSIEVYLDKWKEVINDPQYQDYYIAIVDCHI